MKLVLLVLPCLRQTAFFKEIGERCLPAEVLLSVRAGVIEEFNLIPFQISLPIKRGTPIQVVNPGDSQLWLSSRKLNTNHN